MKLFIQIPCLNEEKTLPSVIAGLPRRIEGIEQIYTLVVDDGSVDNTVEVARRLGVDYIVKNNRSLGLAKSYSRGLQACLCLGADIIVNTDGDNQYQGADIAKLIRPIFEQHSDIVVGCRDISRQQDFAWTKKFLQRLGSKVVRRLSKTSVPDVTSGFRAISRTAAIRCSIMSNFSYTLETLIQAGHTGLKVDWVPIRTNLKSRDSHLFSSNINFIFQQLKTLFIIYLFYCPMLFFNWLATASLAVSALMALRIIYFLWLSDPMQLKFKTGSGMLLLFSSIATVLFFITGLLGSVFSGLRFLMLDIRARLRNIELRENIVPADFHIIRAAKFFEWTKRT